MKMFPVWLDQISALSGIDLYVINRMYRTVVVALNLSPPRIPSQIFVNRFGSQLKFDWFLCEEAKYVCNAVTEKELVDGVASHVVAIAVLTLVLVASGGVPNISDITSVSLVSWPTIGKQYVALRSALSMGIFSESFVMKYLPRSGSPTDRFAHLPLRFEEIITTLDMNREYSASNSARYSTLISASKTAPTKPTGGGSIGHGTVKEEHSSFSGATRQKKRMHVYPTQEAEAEADEVLPKKHSRRRPVALLAKLPADGKFPRRKYLNGFVFTGLSGSASSTC